MCVYIYIHWVVHWVWVKTGLAGSRRGHEKNGLGHPGFDPWPYTAHTYTYIFLCMFFVCHFKQNIVVGAGGGNLCSAALFGFWIEWGKSPTVTHHPKETQETNRRNLFAHFFVALLKVQSGRRTMKRQFFQKITKTTSSDRNYCSSVSRNDNNFTYPGDPGVLGIGFVNGRAGASLSLKFAKAVKKTSYCFQMCSVEFSDGA